MKKIIIIFGILLLTLLFIIFNINNKENKLSKIGYDKNEIKQINKLFTKEEINKYLINKKYDNLLEYKKSKIFNIKNIERYDKYNKSNNYSPLDIVTYVEIGLDKDFYTNIKEINEDIDVLVLVNKYNKLPDNYEASNLITLDKNYSPNNQKVKNEIYINLITMFNDAKKEGLDMKVISGYRSHTTQNNLFTSSTKKNGVNHALLYSAKPGHSEHQTGYAVDINSVEESFANTKEYEFLINNAYKYGFIERYPKGKEYITGYGYEPWHYRYVGIKASTIIHEKNITFEEYKVLY